MSHAIIVVHGVGEHQKSDTVRRFANGFIDFFYRHLKEKSIPPNALQLEVDLQPSQQASQVRISYSHAGLKEDFLIRETWWAKVFQPYDLWEVFLWTLGLIGNRFKEVFRVLTLNPVTWFYALGMFILAFVVALLLFGIIFGLRLLLLVPLLNQPMKSVLSGLQKRAADFLVLVVGDLQVYASDWVYSTEIQESLKEEISRLLTLKEVTDICVVGHSLGSLIAYETLSRNFDHRALDPNQKIRALVTVGSPLDRASLFLDEAHRFRFQSPLPSHIKWLNIYSEKDLISSQLRGFKPGPQNIRVRNKSILFFFKEHSSYWKNRRQETMKTILATVIPSMVSLAPIHLPFLQALQQDVEFYVPESLSKVWRR